MENQNLLSEEKKMALLDCAKWARILAIVTVVSLVFSLISSIIQVIGTGGLGIAAVIGSTLFGGSISIAGAVLLWFFHKHINTACITEDNYSIERGLYNFKWYFGLLGIIMLIVACVVGLVLLFALLFGMAS